MRQRVAARAMLRHGMAALDPTNSTKPLGEVSRESGSVNLRQWRIVFGSHRAPRRRRRRSGGPRPSRGPSSQLLASILGRRTSICASVVELVMPATLSLAKVHFVWPIRSQIMRCNSGETLPAYFRRGRSASRAQKAHGQQPSSRSPRVEATDVPARRAA